MTRIRLIAAATLVALSASAFAQAGVGSAQPAVATAPVAASAAEDEKRICKRALETGSLVKGKKVCLTRREWQRAATQGQELGREMQSLISTERGG